MQGTTGDENPITLETIMATLNTMNANMTAMSTWLTQLEQPNQNALPPIDPRRNMQPTNPRDNYDPHDQDKDPPDVQQRH